MDYTKETVPALKQMCKERKIRGYSKKTKTELIVVLRGYDETEKNEKKDEPSNEITCLKKEISAYRKANLFLEIISSDVFEIILKNLKVNKPLSFDEIQVDDKVEFVDKQGVIWVGQVIKKYRTRVGVKARKYDENVINNTIYMKGKWTNWRISPSRLKMTDKDLGEIPRK